MQGNALVSSFSVPNRPPTTAGSFLHVGTFPSAFCRIGRRPDPSGCPPVDRIPARIPAWGSLSLDALPSGCSWHSVAGWRSVPERELARRRALSLPSGSGRLPGCPARIAIALGRPTGWLQALEYSSRIAIGMPDPGQCHALPRPSRPSRRVRPSASSASRCHRGSRWGSRRTPSRIRRSVGSVPRIQGRVRGGPRRVCQCDNYPTFLNSQAI